MLARIYAIFVARNREFLRDRSSLTWSLLFPVVLMFGLSFAFGGERDVYTIGIYQDAETIDRNSHTFLATRYIDFVAYSDLDSALEKVARHQLDMVVQLSDSPRYWINEAAPNAYFAEITLLESLSPRHSGGSAGDIEKVTVTGDAVGYVDWVLPGILGMNMMFSSLFGVGYVVVRYRKNGFLKRLQATPLTSFEFITAQMASRGLLILLISTFLFLGTHWILGTRMDGSYLALFVVAVCGAVSLISLGMLIAARVMSEELAGGLLNFVNWPMMMLSGVWFSLEGAGNVVQQLANVFPLTHLLIAARAIILDGASLADVLPQLAALTGMSAVFLLVGARIFRWGPQ